MKKILILSFLVILGLTGSVSARYAYELGLFATRADLALQEGVVSVKSDYTGSLEQNLALLKVTDKPDFTLPAFQSLGGASFSSTLPKVIANFETSLASTISDTATSFTLVSGTTDDGNTLSGYYGFTLDAGSSNQEYVIATCTSTACSSATRGVSVENGQTSVTALKFSHRRGASVKITDHPALTIVARILQGQTGIPDTMFYLTSPSGSASSTAIMSKYYIDNVGAGGFTASNVASNQGLRVFGTAPETVGVKITSDGALSTTTALHVKLGNGLATSSNAIVIDTTDNLAFTGTLSTTKTFSAATTTLATTTISKLTVSPSTLTIGATSTASLVNGADADALHQHDYIGVGDWHPKTYYNFSIPFISGSWTATTLTPNYGSAYVSVNASAGSLVTARPIFLRADGGRLDFSKKIVMEWAAAIAGTATGKGHMGFAAGGGANSFQDTTSSDRATFGFTPSNELFAQTGDGTNITNATITAITLTNMNTYRIEYNPNLNTKFYVNGALRATLTLTQPRYAVTTNYPFFGFGTTNAAHYIGTSTTPYFAVEK